MMAKILDIKIDNLTFSQVMQKITFFLEGKGLHQIATVNPEFILAAQKDTEFRRILNGADICVPDGVGLRLAAWMTGQKIGERITGVDLTWEICKLAAERGFSVFFLGAKEGVAQKTAQRLKIVHPRLKIAGCYSGTPEERGIEEMIMKSRADILLVAFGAPKQEKFIAKLKNDIHQLKSVNCKLKIAIGVGGTFDYIAGVIPRAPRWMRSLGLEWLYRLIQQPSRISRIFRAVVVFPSTVIFKLK